MPRLALVLARVVWPAAPLTPVCLAALAEVAGWDPRTAAVVAGTSVGSITGATLRAGLPTRDLLARPAEPKVAGQLALRWP